MRYHPRGRKKPANLSIASFGLRAVFANVPTEKSYSSALYREKEDSDPHLVLSFYHHLDPLHQWTKFSTKICVGFFLQGNSKIFNVYHCPSPSPQPLGRDLFLRCPDREISRLQNNRVRGIEESTVHISACPSLTRHPYYQLRARNRQLCKRINWSHSLLK